MSVRVKLVSFLVVSVLILLLFGYTPSSAPVSRDMAEHVAEYYARVAPPPELSDATLGEPPPIAELRLEPLETIIGYFVPLEPTGYLVISADTRIVPLIAYSGTSDLPLYSGEENAFLDFTVQDLKNRLDAAQEDMIPSTQCNEIMWEEILTEPISTSPFQFASYSMAYIDRRYSGTGRSIAFPNDWHQRDPYNGECPRHPAETGAHCRVGCVALAMAQIIAHYQCPGNVVIAQGTSYKVEGKDRTVGSDKRSDFRYPLSPTSAPETEVVKALCATAGLSVNTEYGLISSAASLKDAAAALTGPWRYRSATVMGLNWSPEVSSTVAEDVFSQKLRDEASAGQPLLLSLAGTTGRHAVVCDGWERETTDMCYVDRFHLRMGGVGTGTDSWYNLPEEHPKPYSGLSYGIFDIRPPTDCAATTYGLALTVDKGCGVRYASEEEIAIICSVDRASSVGLFDFDPRYPGGNPQIFPREYEKAGTHSLSGDVKGEGIEVIVARAISGTTVRMAACRIPVGVSPSLLGLASLTTQKGCDASFSTGDRLVVTYSVSVPVSNVWIFVITSEDASLLTPAPLRKSQGQITSSTTIGPTKGDRMLVLVAATAQGTVAATCRYTVP